MEWLGDVADRLLAELAQAGGFVSAKELSDKLGASQKTIYRTVRDINNASPAGEIISSRRGLGYQLVATDGIGNAQKPEVLTPAVRRKDILGVLLRAAPDPVDFEELRSKLFISESLLRADIKSIAKEVAGFGLSLRREQWKIWVQGTEVSIRQALSSLVDSTALETMYVDPGFVENSFEESDLAFARQQVEIVEELLGGKLPNPYDINLASHLYVMVTRSRRRESPVTPAINLVETTRDERAWDIAQKVVIHVQDYLGVGALPEEVPYVYAYLVSSRGGHQIAELPQTQDVSIQVTDALMGAMTRILGVDFSSARMRNDLARHVRPLLNRLRYGITLTNPVVAQVRAEYLDIFEALEACCREVFGTVTQAQLSDDEIGFLALYFARETESLTRPIRVLVCCSTGIGTSELLRVKIEKAFPEVRIIGLTSIGSVTEDFVRDNRVELVISTIRGLSLPTVPVIVVDVMFTERSQDLVRKALRGI